MSLCCLTEGGNRTSIEEQRKLQEQSRRSKQLTQALKQEKAQYERTHRILLLGAGESGKSTIVKQMEIAFVNGFSDEIRKDFAEIIRNNLLEAVRTILEVMPQLKISLHDEGLEPHKQYILSCVPNGSNLPRRFYDSCQRIALDTSITECLKRNNEYQGLDSAAYFLEPNKIREIAKEDYRPSDKDILRSRKKTQGIFETKFVMEGENFHIFDVGGQREERKKWIQCFNDVTAIIFVVESSGYDCVIREDDQTNRLEESLMLFEKIWKNQWLDRISIILFLNKQDLLQLKILEGRTMEPYFPDIEAYTTPDFSDSTDPEMHKIAEEETHFDVRVRRARWFIREQFMRISEFNSAAERRLYTHFTTAIDTDNIRRVFLDCKKIVHLINLKNFHMLANT